MNDISQVLFTDNELRELHKRCMIKLIAKCRKYKDSDRKEYDRRLRIIKNLFFDKLYYKRGFSYNPQTKKYRWFYD